MKDWVKRFAMGVMACVLLVGVVAPQMAVAGEVVQTEYDAAIDVEVPDTAPKNMDPDTEYKQCEKEAGVFSWVVCPLMDWLMGVAKDLSEKIDGFLRVDPQIFGKEGEENPPLFEGWSGFRDLTNVVLVIIFIAIIISQITGFGIDNYGIKKMLPRLIVLAIIINLSYILAQVAVDLSNIVGSQVYQFLEGLADRSFQIEGLGAAESGGAALSALVAAAIAGVLTALINPVSLISLLLALIGALISAMFMFLLLGVRQAAVALFVIVAPLALAANILPNTANLYKKWFDIFKTLLMMHPIAGLVMGAGYYGARLLMALNAGGSFIYAVVALILLFVPAFFIPKLVQGAFAGMGKIGGAITGLGGKFSGMATGAVDKGIRGTQAVKRFENRRLERKEQRGDARVNARAERRLGGRTNLSERQQARLIEARRSQAKMEEGERADEAVLDDRYIDSQRNKGILSQEAQIRELGTTTGADYMQAMRNKAQVQERRETGDLARMASGSYIPTSEAGIESAEMAQAVKDREALAASTYHDNTAAMQAQLTTALTSAPSQEREANIRAYQNLLSRQGDAGREAVRTAMMNAEAGGAGAVDDEARRVYGSNIMNNFGADYKANARSTFNYAQDASSGSMAAGQANAGSTIAANYAGAAVDQAKPETLAAMDNEEYRRLENAAVAGGPGEVAKLQQRAYEALKNPNLTNMNGGRRTKLEEMVNGTTPGFSAYTPPTPPPVAVDTGHFAHMGTPTTYVPLTQFRNADGSTYWAKPSTPNVAENLNQYTRRP